ncbi:plasmid pRiA4b ORF-3 family protein [Nocardioides sp.]|uniref:plasmid pRiA4b ORF-3 family protein n=1 Tax=Nocardioides sp. TaxID=35761 RepID=UPI0035B21323
MRIALDEVEPPIWRRLDVAGDLDLAELHEILQTAMGWTDSHLHNFLASRDRRVPPILTDFDEEEGDEGVNERDVRVDQVLQEVGDEFYYAYDFGDGWEHAIRLEEVLAYDDSLPRARLLAGARACPPEDCGGPGGYARLVEAMTHGPRTAAERDLLAWAGDWDQEAFSVEETDGLLRLTLTSMAGSAGMAASLRAIGSGFSDMLAELVDQSRREPKLLARTIAAAELDHLEIPGPATRRRLMHPWLHLLDVVGDGLALTSAGWLPPAVVSRLATDLDLHEPWMGKGNREQNFPPVKLLRSTAMDLGLLRKRKGELLPTAAGRRLTGDPEGMWHHLVASLPLGRTPVQNHAGAIALLAVASGEQPPDLIRRWGSDLLWSAGWASEGNVPPLEWDVLEYARPTWNALRVIHDSPLSRRSVPEELRQLARAALRRSRLQVVE